MLKIKKSLKSENLCKREEALKRNMDQLEDAERKSKLQEARDQYRRLEQQNEDIAEREIQIREEINTMERDQAKWSELVDKFRKAFRVNQNQFYFFVVEKYFNF